MEAEEERHQDVLRDRLPQETVSSFTLLCCWLKRKTSAGKELDLLMPDLENPHVVWNESNPGCRCPTSQHLALMEVVALKMEFYIHKIHLKERLTGNPSAASVVSVICGGGCENMGSAVGHVSGLITAFAFHHKSVWHRSCFLMICAILPQRMTFSTDLVLSKTCWKSIYPLIHEWTPLKRRFSHIEQYGKYQQDITLSNVVKQKKVIALT